MNINSVGQNNFLNFAQVNQNISNKSENSPNIVGIQGGRKDSVSISPMGKAMSVIESLMKQKEQINERKNELIGDTLENGGDIDSIKSQLESYELQLEAVDEEISDIMTQEMEDKNKEPKNYSKTEPKTQEDAEQQQFSNLVTMSADIEKAEVIASVKTKLESELSSLSSSDTPSKATLEKASQISERIENITPMIFEKLASVNDKIEENNNQEIIITEDVGEKVAETTEIINEDSQNVIITDEDEKVLESKEALN